jgi:glycosyltransferase 2 family protein
MGALKRVVWGLLLAVAVVGIASIVRDWHSFVDQIAKFPPSVLMQLLVATTAGYALRAIRWHGFLERLGSRVAWPVDALMYIAGFAFTASPGKAGEAGRGMLLKPFGVPYSRTLGLCITERLLDLASIVFLTGLGAAVLAGFAWLPVMAVALLVAVLFTLSNAALSDALIQRAAAILGKHGARVVEGLQRSLHEVRALQKPGVVLSGLAIGTAGWLLEATGFWLLASAIALPLAWSTSVGIYALSLLAGALSFLPGGLVGTELVMIALLTKQGVAAPTALTITIAARVATLGYSLALGAVALAVSRWVISRAPKPA